MPELAEVETARRRIEKALKGKKIVRAIPAAGDRTVYDRDPPERVKKTLEGARVRGTGRVGKYFWIDLDRGVSVVIHLGMTGDVRIRDPKGKILEGWGSAPSAHSRSRGSGGDPEDIPRFSRLFLVAADGTEVAITDPRRFGRIRLAKNPREEAPIAGMGADVFEKPPTLAALEAVFGKRRIPIKTLLLDQSHFAGIGNWLADEILYQARISPHRPACSLTRADISRLRSKMNEVLRRSVSVAADSERFPKSWLFHRRWSKGRAPKAGAEKIVFDTIGGRTSAWNPARQK